jgi:hypothetical protein
MEDQNSTLTPLKSGDVSGFSGRELKKSLLMKSFSNPKDNRGNCAMENTDFMKKK